MYICANAHGGPVADNTNIGFIRLKDANFSSDLIFA